MDNRIELLGIILLWVLLITSVYSIVTYEPPKPYNITETVNYKDISHIGAYGDITNYNIYTTNYHFSVSLTEYNLIRVGDNLTVTVDNGIGYLYYLDSIYTMEIE